MMSSDIRHIISPSGSVAGLSAGGLVSGAAVHPFSADQAARQLWRSSLLLYSFSRQRLSDIAAPSGLLGRVFHPTTQKMNSTGLWLLGHEDGRRIAQARFTRRGFPTGSQTDLRRSDRATTRGSISPPQT